MTMTQTQTQPQPQPSKPAGGVLPISAAATATTKKGGSQQQQQAAKKNGDAARLKLIVRRLPPGLTQSEFDTAMGDEWKSGAGKVDYYLYKEGKVSKDAAKPSRPSRAYLRVVSAPLIQELADKVRQTSFQDARNTALDPALVGPPSVEYAPYARTPSGKTRKDGRLGTIDQDMEFITFLESLTNPPAPKGADEAAAEQQPQKEEKPAITPLIQFLRDKKANKGKEPSSHGGKSAKQARAEATKVQQQQQKKVEKVQAKKLLSRSERAAEKQQTKTADKDKASKDVVKAAANKQNSGPPPPANKNLKSPEASSAKDNNAAAPSAPATERKRERGNVSAATKILRRDLGLGPAPPGRKRDRAGGTAAADTTTTTTTPTTKADVDKSSPKSPTTTDQPKPPTGPKGGKQGGGQKSTSAKPTKKEPSTEAASSSSTASQQPPTNATNNANNTPTGPAGTKSKQPSGPKQQQEPAQQSTATQAFLKHANPSQGVTEDLLESGFAQFGSVTAVEIDRKKGFGYVDFAEPESLRKAVQASPVQIAESQVVVLERRTGPAVKETRGNNNHAHQPSMPQQQQQQQSPAAAPQGPRGGRGGRGGGRAKGGFGGRGRGGRGGKPAPGQSEGS